MTRSLDTEAIFIPGQPGIDAIEVYFSDYAPGKGSVTLTCYGSAWTSYFNAMGDNAIREFFLKTGDDYLVNKLTDYSVNPPKRREKYLLKVIQAVRAALAGSVPASQVARDEAPQTKQSSQSEHTREK